MVWAEDIATATFNGKNATYTEGWSTTGTGVDRADCVIIGYGENITSPEFDLSGYSSVTISIKARRFGSLSGKKATIDVSIGGESVGTTEATSTDATTSLTAIAFTPTASMTEAVFVFTCTNATSVGSTHGAGINTITITGVKASTGTLESIVLSGEYPTSFYVGDDFSHEGMTVTANYSDGFTAVVTDDATFTGYDMTTAGAQTVTVSYTDKDVTKTATYGITVSERPTFTVTLADDGTELVEATGGAGVTLPSRTDLGNYSFAGWSETYIATETATAPTIIAAGEYYPEEDITLYPIYRTGEASEHSVNIGEYATANDWTTEGGNGQYYSVELDDDVTASVSQSGNNGKVYTNSDVVNWRLYSGGTLTITSKTGNIVSVLFKTQDSGFGIKYGETALSRGELFTVNGGKSVSFSITTTTRITDIEVNTGSYTYVSAPVTSATITDAGYATFSNKNALDFSANQALTVYTATDNGTSVKLNEVTSKKVPANTPVVLKGTAGNYPATIISSADALGANDLRISNGSTATAEANIYVLANKTSNGVGFYKWAGTSSLSAGKIYLQATSSAPFLGFDADGETTGISSLTPALSQGEGVYYDLSGRRVAQPTKGLYIVNGKKVLVP